MMKKLTSIILAAVFAPVSCNTFDHEAILEQLCDHWQRIRKLEALCNKPETPCSKVAH